jgi:hypothetical protein
VIRNGFPIHSFISMFVDTHPHPFHTQTREEPPMSVIIHQPEIEALIQQRMATGTFPDVEAVLLHALKSSPISAATPAVGGRPQSLVEVCAMVQGLTDDLDLSRDPSPGRSISFS